MLQFFEASTFFDMRNIFFSQKKMIQEKDILNRLQPLEKPRTEVLCASYGTIQDRTEKEAGDEMEEMTTHLT